MPWSTSNVGNTTVTLVKTKKKDLLYRGGMADVWSADRDGETVAVKVLRLDGIDPAKESELRSRFLREIRIQKDLDHPNIMPILGYNKKDTWYSMPMAERSLEQHLANSPSGVGETDAVEIFREILKAVSFAHDNDVLHRDLKPGNVLLFDDRWCVSDFGLCRLVGSDSTTLTKANAGFGTLVYSAPEQFEDAHSADERADIYALGKIFYKLLTGRTPNIVEVDLVPGEF